MNKRKLFSWCFILICINATAQTKNELADDTLLKQELLMTKYDKDTSAEAVILSDIGSASILQDDIDNHFKKYYTHTIKTKILSQAGLSNATFFIPLFNNGETTEEITNLEGKTYNLEDGKVVSVPLSNEVYEDKKSKYVTIKRIAMPNVKVGSVIYISYTIKSTNITNFTWDFQHTIPVAYSECNLIIPAFSSYMSLTQNMDTSGLVKFVKQEAPFHTLSNLRFRNVVYSYSYKDIPAFKDEAFIPTQEDYVRQIGFQLSKWQPSAFASSNSSFLSNWKEFTDKLLDIPTFGGYLSSKQSYLEDIIKQLKLGGQPEQEQIRLIVTYVKSNYKWDNSYSLSANKNIKNFLEEKFGNSADINLFLTALLRAAKINATPVILSTRSHGKIKANYPFINFYNDVICYVKTDSLSLLLDATDPLLPYYAIPSQCTNGFGYVIQKNDSSKIDLSPVMSAKIINLMLVQVSDNLDSVNCQFNVKGTGYSSYAFRKDWGEGYQKLSSVLAGNKGLEIKDSIKVSGKDDMEKPFSMSFSASLPLIKQQIDTSNKYRLIFSPFLNQPISNNPLKMPDRKYPVDMDYAHEYKYQATVIIPKGYKLAELPTEIIDSIKNNDATYSYKVKQVSDGVIQFTSDLSFNVPVFQPAEYKELKVLYDVAIKKCKEPIILEKK